MDCSHCFREFRENWEGVDFDGGDKTLFVHIFVSINVETIV